tara:strand:+ start:1220 stop:1495 length:276 start_codon:yes stop_codon:yes gene_type:complete
MKKRCYVNKYGYFNLSSMDIDESLLIGVEIIDDMATAERRFKEENDMADEEDVFIPSVFESEGVIYGEDLNTCASPIEELSAEEYINNYIL